MLKKLFILLGWFGTLIILFGTTQKPSHVYYIAGAVILLATAIYYRLFFYIALELILIAGHLAIILRIGPYTQLFLPILLCTQLLTFYFVFGKVKIFLVLGILGIAFLSIGLAYNNQWIFFFWQYIYCHLLLLCWAQRTTPRLYLGWFKYRACFNCP